MGLGLGLGPGRGLGLELGLGLEPKPVLQDGMCRLLQGDRDLGWIQVNAMWRVWRRGEALGPGPGPGLGQVVLVLSVVEGEEVV